MAGRSKFTLDGGGSEGGSGGENSGGEPNGAGANTGHIDPATAFTGGTPDSGDASEFTGKLNKDGSQQRKRGRKPGTGKAQASGTIDPDNIEVLLFNVHSMLAMMTGIGQLELNQQEAGTLAKAVCTVQAYYPTHISAKSLAWANLVMVAGGIYGSRAVAVWAENQAEKQEPRPPAPTGLHVVNPQQGRDAPPFK